MSDYPMERATQLAAEVLDLHEKGQTLEGEAWDKNADAYKSKCVASAAILAVKLQDALAQSERLAEALGVLYGALIKICEPITVAAPAETVSACQDLHELICDIAREAIAKAKGKHASGAVAEPEGRSA